MICDSCSYAKWEVVCWQISPVTGISLIVPLCRVWLWTDAEWRESEWCEVTTMESPWCTTVCADPSSSSGVGHCETVLACVDWSCLWLQTARKGSSRCSQCISSIGNSSVPAHSVETYALNIKWMFYLNEMLQLAVTGFITDEPRQNGSTCVDLVEDCKKATCIHFLCRNKVKSKQRKQSS